MALKKVRFQPGFDKQGTPAAAPGKWIDGDFVRFRYGIPEKIGGWQQLSNDQNTLPGVARAQQLSLLWMVNDMQLSEHHRVYFYTMVVPFMTLHL